MLVRQLIAVVGLPLFEIWREHSWLSAPPEGWSFPVSTILVCPSCQKVWAHLAFDEPTCMGEPPGCLWPRGEFCEDCHIITDQHPVPGSILFYYGYACNIDLALLHALPEPLLRREFELHLRQFD